MDQDQDNKGQPQQGGGQSKPDQQAQEPGRNPGRAPRRTDELPKLEPETAVAQRVTA